MDSDLDDEVADAAPARDRRRIVTAAFVGVVVLALFVSAMAWFWHWRTHPDVFDGVGNAMGVEMNTSTRPTVYVAITDPDQDSDKTVTIDAISPRLLENTAGASFAFFICDLDDEDARGSGILFVNPGSFDDNCPHPVPVVHGTPLEMSELGNQQLVMAVTVHQPGLARARGVDITYTDGWQHGTQTVGMRMHFESR